MFRSRPSVYRFLAALIAVLVFAAACGDGDDGDANAGATPASSAVSTPAATVSGDLTVFAASSLTEAFTEIGDAFETAHPGTSVSFNFDGSPALRTQLEQGARADIFASANTAQMDMAVASGVVEGESTVFARNRLVVIVPSDNSAGIESLQDLAKDGVKLVLANEDVPVGQYARQFLDNASADPAFGASFKHDVLANLVSEEGNVRQVAARVQLGEADAAVVFSSDVTPDLASDVTRINIPDALNQLATYPLAVTSDARNPDTAQAFIDFILGEEGQAILVKHGLLRATP
jgi:molybdate transport system substrate-binding protein